MNKLRRLVGLTCATVIAATAAATLGAGSSNALVADEYSTVRQWVCSETNAVVDLDYVNQYGNFTTRNNTRFTGQRSQNGAVTCIYKDLRAGEYGQYVSTTVADEDGGYVSCAIFVDGVKVSESTDNSDYYSYASCY